MTKTLFDILDSWTLIVDRGRVEITLNDISSSFYQKKVVFLLLEDIWDIIEQFDDPTEFMTEGRLMMLIEKILRDEQKEKVAKFVQVEESGPPYFKTTVLNVDETINQFPSWFRAYEGITWDEFSSSLLDE
ncbi:MAG: hypothetical protein ACW98U_13190 [Candidatus Thorarchaeota archaeon]|jgi:hypothetical protein